PHLSLDNTDRASLEDEADAISNAASGAPFDYRSRCSIGLRASSPDVHRFRASLAHNWRTTKPLSVLSETTRPKLGSRSAKRRRVITRGLAQDGCDRVTLRL
ncbi:MAG: hypothetical protein ACRDJJ_03805, partial [Actinomycetota bacterium]